MMTFLAAAAAALTTAPQIDQLAPRIEVSIRGDLKDPESARFEWPFAFTDKPHGGDIEEGAYWTCGRFNARNSFGGYGEEDWIYVEVYGGKFYAYNSEQHFFVDMLCDRAVRKNLLPPRT